MKVYGEDQSRAWNANTIINGWGTNDFVKMDEARQNYTGEKITETVTTAGAYKLVWGPVKQKAVYDDATGTYHDYKIVPAAGGSDVFGDFATDADLADRTIPASAGLVTGDKVGYVYDNKYIPAEQLPTVTMRMAKKPVEAHVRRIAIVYSKLAAFQAKKEYGFDLKSELVQQATAELEYEIDTEIIDTLTALGDKNVTAHIMSNGRYFDGYGVPIKNSTGTTIGYNPITWVDEELLEY